MRVMRYDGPGLQVTRSVCRAGAALALMALIVSGCSRLKIIGQQPANQKPELILVNVPAGGQLFGANPIVYWFGTDIDGRILRYDYAVVPESTVKLFIQRHNNCSQGTSDADRFIQCGVDSMPWVSIFVDSVGSSLPTQEKVPLYASFDTLDCDSVPEPRFIPPDSFYIETVPVNCVSMAIPQYMFIRAIDDQGEKSEIKYRSFLRNNHWPETAMNSLFEAYKIYFSVPSLSETYLGIELMWGGTDRGDFLRDQPEMEFHWRVYGPYDIGEGTLADRPVLSDTILFAAPLQHSQNSDPRKGVWVRDTITAVYNLWRQVDAASAPPDTTRRGFFLFVVQSRDDASVSDPSPAWTAFEAVYPKFERKLLVVDETGYTISPGGYPSWGNQNKDTNHAFLYRIARQIDANIVDPPGKHHDPWTPELDFWERMDQPAMCGPDPPNRCAITVPVTELSRHEMVLYIDDDIIQPITKDPDMRGSLTQYLDIGGKLWLVSRIGFFNGTDIGPGAGAKIIDFVADRNYFAPRYFGVSGMYFAGWYEKVKQTPPSSNDEFIGADAISSNDPALQIPSNLPAKMDVDSLRIYMHWVPLRQFLTDVIVGVPAVGYVLRWTDAARAPATRPLYVFRSWRPGFSPADGRLVSVRTIGPTMQTPKYKTAFTGCPLWFFEENQAMEYVAGMTDWFYNHAIEEGP